MTLDESPKENIVEKMVKWCMKGEFMLIKRVNLLYSYEVDSPEYAGIIYPVTIKLMRLRDKKMDIDKEDLGV